METTPQDIMTKAVANYVEGTCLPVIVDEMIGVPAGHFGHYTDGWDDEETRYRTEAVTDTLERLLGEDLSKRAFEFTRLYLEALQASDPEHHAFSDIDDFVTEEFYEVGNCLPTEDIANLVARICAL